MWTWVSGTRLLAERDRKAEIPLADFLDIIRKRPPARVPGTAVYLTAHPEQTPVALMHSLKHFKLLHEENVLLTVRTAEVPRIAEAERVVIEPVAAGFRRVTMTFGYMEEPNVPHGLALCRKLGWKFDIMTVSFLVSRRSLKPAARSELPLWQGRLFIYLARNAAGAADYFHIPAGRVVEIGTQVNL